MLEGMDADASANPGRPAASVARHEWIDTKSEWEANSESWTTLTRSGHDRYRDLVNTPAFFSMLPPIDGLRCLDLGCGEGHNTRLLHLAGGRAIGLDIVEAFARASIDCEPAIPTVVGNGCSLPFQDASFDVVTAFMSLMDLADPEAALREISRVLRAGGFTQFSIGHPVSTTPIRQWCADPTGKRSSLQIGDYFSEGPVTDRWVFGTAPDGARPFTSTLARRTVSTWLNMIIDCGLRITRVAEPFADEATAAEHPDVADTRIVPYFLILRAHKPRLVRTRQHR
jgi:SAM-dependent methyltransferase